MIIKIFIAIIIFENLVIAEINKGVVTLDELTFDKVSIFLYSSSTFYGLVEINYK
jgi:hypothetical protein